MGDPYKNGTHLMSKKRRTAVIVFLWVWELLTDEFCRVDGVSPQWCVWSFVPSSNILYQNKLILVRCTLINLCR